MFLELPLQFSGHVTHALSLTKMSCLDFKFNDLQTFYNNTELLSKDILKITV
jgi:hypothetical protein